MTLTEFNQETDKLEKFYGKTIEDFEKDIWYKELKNMPIKRFEQIIKKIFTENKFMPKLADIISLNKDLPIEQQEIKKVKCQVCNGKGYVVYKKEIDGMLYDFIARCDCQNGNEYRYDDGHWYIPSVNQLGL